MDDFSNRVALVTGAARGQGRAHAIAFAERGADVVVCDRCADSPAIAYPMGTEEDLAETVRLVEATGRRCIAVKADTADRAAMEALVARAENELGRVDVAVANAGVSGTSPITEASAAVWEEVIGSNLTGVYNTLAAVAPGMIARGYGRIITISSMLGRSAAQGQAAYGASKWGVIGMTKSVALDLAAHGITVNAIAPGNISTPMVHNDALYSVVRPDLDAPTRADVEPVMAMLHAQPIAFLEPEEVTRAVLFFAAEASAHITGTVLPVDAGAAARVSS
ncbi:mycofactocin-coupled SDR family oxidoreductase [Gordonia sp. LUNF6]|uniref:mycofactocin-coupled SDR family oxidoreductase n=1 Tax=Gordonia TaxID=2053 RepID=UPI0005ED4C62|nr:mycofactocin-coupled SDR family oxidoreductase [Gordonia sihwensis]KJR08088.1 3-ketoacyl-ACP reductase [Gordonia sihwensis]MBY4570700.1 3-ketoacyl-ACP reductase [Gordonia sihwensis]WFN94762.1 mycofactocin-coupled SDR family oxidoreductase [Gordonia sihwensis]